MYVLNFIFYILLLFEFLFHFFSEKNHKSFDVLFFIGLNSIVFLLVIFSTKNCFNLVYAGENNIGLTVKQITTSKIVNVLYSIYTSIILIGASIIINSYMEDWKYIKDDFFLIFRGVFFALLCCTSLSLCIFYWILLKKIKMQFNETLNSIGNTNN